MTLAQRHFLCKQMKMNSSHINWSCKCLYFGSCRATLQNVHSANIEYFKLTDHFECLQSLVFHGASCHHLQFGILKCQTLVGRQYLRYKSTDEVYQQRAAKWLWPESLLRINVFIKLKFGSCFNNNIKVATQIIFPSKWHLLSGGVGAVVKISASQSWGPRFDSRPGQGLNIWVTFFPAKVHSAFHPPEVGKMSTSIHGLIWSSCQRRLYMLPVRWG